MFNKLTAGLFIAIALQGCVAIHVPQKSHAENVCDEQPNLPEATEKDPRDGLYGVKVETAPQKFRIITGTSKTQARTNVSQYVADEVLEVPCAHGEDKGFAEGYQQGVVEGMVQGSTTGGLGYARRDNRFEYDQFGNIACANGPVRGIGPLGIGVANRQIPQCGTRYPQAVDYVDSGSEDEAGPNYEPVPSRAGECHPDQDHRGKGRRKVRRIGQPTLTFDVGCDL